MSDATINLTQALLQHPDFTQLPASKQEVHLRLAAQFQDNDHALYLTPSDLTKAYGLGNKELWQEFLTLTPVKHYIKGQTAFLATVAQRSAFPAIAKAAASGDVQAAKMVNELSGFMNRGEHNKIVVLHQISRPSLKQVDEKEAASQ